MVCGTAEVPHDDSWLTARERQDLTRFHVATRRQDWRLGRWTAKSALHEVLGLVPEEVEVRVAADGAPEAFYDRSPLPVALSLSHRGGLALAAVAQPATPVGCDLELIEPRAAVFARDWFTPSEQDLVDAALLTERDRVVTMIWSVKESALKALRTGLRRDTRSVVVGPTGAAVGEWRGLVVSDTEGGVDLPAWWRLWEGLVLTVAGPGLAEAPSSLAGDSHRSN